MDAISDWDGLSRVFFSLGGAGDVAANAASTSAAALSSSRRTASTGTKTSATAEFAAARPRSGPSRFKSSSSRLVAPVATSFAPRRFAGFAKRFSLFEILSGSSASGAPASVSGGPVSAAPSRFVRVSSTSVFVSSTSVFSLSSTSIFSSMLFAGASARAASAFRRASSNVGACARGRAAAAPSPSSASAGVARRSEPRRLGALDEGFGDGERAGARGPARARRTQRAPHVGEECGRDDARAVVRNDVLGEQTRAGVVARRRRRERHGGGGGFRAGLRGRSREHRRDRARDGRPIRRVLERWVALEHDAKNRVADARTSFASREATSATSLPSSPANVAFPETFPFPLARRSARRSAADSHSADASARSSDAIATSASRYAPTCSPAALSRSCAARINPSGRLLPLRTRSRTRASRAASSQDAFARASPAPVAWTKADQEF